MGAFVFDLEFVVPQFFINLFWELPYFDVQQIVDGSEEVLKSNAPYVDPPNMPFLLSSLLLLHPISVQKRKNIQGMG